MSFFRILIKGKSKEFKDRCYKESSEKTRDCFNQFEKNKNNYKEFREEFKSFRNDES